jgi:thioredoxin reductase (NADPH)
VFLAEHAAQCSLMIRGGDLGKSMSRYLVDQIERDDKLSVIHDSEVVELRGDNQLEAVVLRNRKTDLRHELEVKALFIFIGASPHTDWLRGAVAMDDKCFIRTGRDLQGEDLAAYPDGERPLFLETSRPGVFAVGDVHGGSIKRVASAVGEGSMAVQFVHEYLKEM